MNKSKHCINHVKMIVLDYIQSYVSLFELDKIVCDSSICIGIEETTSGRIVTLYDKMGQALSASILVPWISYRVDPEAVRRTLKTSCSKHDETTLSLLSNICRFIGPESALNEDCADLTLIGEYYGDLSTIIIQRAIMPTSGSLDTLIDMGLNNLATLTSDNRLRKFVLNLSCSPDSNIGPESSACCNSIVLGVKALAELASELKPISRETDETSSSSDKIKPTHSMRFAIIFPFTRFPMVYYQVLKLLTRYIVEAASNIRLLEMDIYLPEGITYNKEIMKVYRIITNRIIDYYRNKNIHINLRIAAYTANEHSANYLIKKLKNTYGRNKGIVENSKIFIVLDMEHKLFHRLNSEVEERNINADIYVVGWVFRRRKAPITQELQIVPKLEVYPLRGRI